MKVGTKINGRYQIKELIGTGGMAKVYLAHDLILDRDVAVKMLRIDFRDDESIMRRFQREALAATELVHPNVVSIYDVGEENGLQYIVMEYVNGTDLKEYIHNNYPISFDQIVKMMEQILSAIALAHKKQIIHRDLKPQNILVDSAGNCKITDFGIALALTETSVTQTNTLLGSVHYLSPEQARGGVATKQSDIYALGIILYEMLTGDVPFDGESAVSIALQHFQEEIPSIKAYYPNVPQALENVVRKATAKDPADRYSSAEGMAEDLQTVLNASRVDEPVWMPGTKTLDDVSQDDLIDFNEDDDNDELEDLQQPVSNEEVKKVPPKKNKAKLGIILVVILLLIGGCTALFYSGGRNIDIPDVKGKTIDEATKILTDDGFKVDSKYHYKYSDSVAKDHVITTDPADTAAKKGSEVELYISKGPKEAVIENYVGKNYDDIVRELKKKGIKSSQIKKELRMSSAYEKGQIISQTPTSGVLKRGEGEITFVVSSGTTGKMKDLKDMNQEEVSTYAKENGLTLVAQYEYTTKNEDGVVLSQDPSPRTEIQVGDTIFVTFAKKVQSQNQIVNNNQKNNANNQENTQTSKAQANNQQQNNNANVNNGQNAGAQNNNQQNAGNNNQNNNGNATQNGNTNAAQGDNAVGNANDNAQNAANQNNQVNNAGTE